MREHVPTPIIDMTAEKAQSRFDELQSKLIPLWRTIDHFNQEEQTIVVVPSISIEVDVPGTLFQAYEERFLFLLLLLRQPRARLIYVTSQSIRPEIIDYYLHLLPGVIASQARKRLFLVSPLDASRKPLSLKILERPRLIRHLRSLILDADRAHLVPFMNTVYERDLAISLGIPMYGADPKFFYLGTKSGCRRLFAEAGVNHPLGHEDLRSEAALVDAICEMRAAKPEIRQVIVKQDAGVSGMGNALLPLEDLPSPADTGERGAVAKRLQSLQFEVAGVTYESYMEHFIREGGIVEERIQGQAFRSPSAQLRITPLGDVEMLSTHDQMLGGPSGQTYLGARFPADPAYAWPIMREAKKVGELLAEKGVIGRFAIDFVAVRSQDSGWQIYAIEINLRKGGTTHPFLTLQFLTDGRYDAEEGVFITPRGSTKYFIASDHVQSTEYRVFTHEDLFDIAVCDGLHFDQSRQTGVVFHMLSALGEFGMCGLTAMGDSPDEAEQLYQKSLHALNAEAQRALI